MRHLFHDYALKNIVFPSMTICVVLHWRIIYLVLLGRCCAPLLHDYALNNIVFPSVINYVCCSVLVSFMLCCLAGVAHL